LKPKLGSFCPVATGKRRQEEQRVSEICVAFFVITACAHQFHQLAAGAFSVHFCHTIILANWHLNALKREGYVGLLCKFFRIHLF